MWTTDRAPDRLSRWQVGDHQMYVRNNLSYLIGLFVSGMTGISGYRQRNGVIPSPWSRIGSFTDVGSIERSNAACSTTAFGPSDASGHLNLDPLHRCVCLKPSGGSICSSRRVHSLQIAASGAPPRTCQLSIEISHPSVLSDPP